jgi:hypothetical protein
MWGFPRNRITWYLTWIFIGYFALLFDFQRRVWIADLDHATSTAGCLCCRGAERGYYYFLAGISDYVRGVPERIRGRSMALWLDPEAGLTEAASGRHFSLPDIGSPLQCWWRRHVGCYARRVGCCAITRSAAEGLPLSGGQYRSCLRSATSFGNQNGSRIRLHEVFEDVISWVHFY